MRMTIHDTNGLSAAAKTLLESGAWTDGAQRVKHNVRRSIYRVPPGTEHPGLYVKHDHPVNPRDLLKILWRCKARQEYEAGVCLAAAGVPVVGMLAWGRRGRHSFLATRELAGVRSLAEYLVELEQAPAARPLFLERFALFLKRLLAAGVRHPDLHVGNVLVAGAVTEPDLVLVDVYGVAAGPPSVRGTLQVRAFAVNVLGLLNVTAQYRFFCRLAAGTTRDTIDAYRQEAHALVRRGFRRRWVGRRRGFLQAGRVCKVRRDAAGKWLIRSRLDAEAPARWLAAYRALPAEGPAWLKRDRKRLLARVTDGAVSCVVKEFCQPGPWGPWRPDCRCWVNTSMCEIIGVPVMSARAWLKARDGRGFVFLQDGGDVTLRRAFQEPLQPFRRRSLLCQIAWILGRLHAYGILHGDCKATNFMVVPAAQVGGWRSSPWGRRGTETVFMVDADSLRPPATLSLAECADNLRGWWVSLPNRDTVTRQERARFLVTYACMAGLTRRERHSLGTICGRST